WAIYLAIPTSSSSPGKPYSTASAASIPSKNSPNLAVTPPPTGAPPAAITSGSLPTKATLFAPTATACDWTATPTSTAASAATSPYPCARSGVRKEYPTVDRSHYRKNKCAFQEAKKVC